MAVTLELERPIVPADVFARADLEFRGVDHSGPSFEARIFRNNPGAGPETPREASDGEPRAVRQASASSVDAALQARDRDGRPEAGIEDLQGAEADGDGGVDRY